VTAGASLSAFAKRQPEVGAEAVEKARPLTVMQLTALERPNYYLNNIVDYTSPNEVRYVVVTMTAESDFSSELRRHGVVVYSLDCLQRRQYPRAVRLVKQIIHDHDVDIVHTHMFEPTLLGVSAAKWLGKRTVITRHHSDAIYRIENAAKRAGYIALEHYCNRLADHIIAPSKAVLGVLVERQGVARFKVSLIPYPQDARRFEVPQEQVSCVREELGMRRRTDLVCVSRLHPEKGHKYLFQALAALKRDGMEFSLYLVGEGALRDSLQWMARELDIADNVHFLGWRDDALAIVAAADVVVHPSLQEALPSAIIEAMALQKPIVATDVSGIRDIVDQYGSIVPPADVAAFQAALRRAVGNLDAARSLAARGRARLLQYMDASRVAREYVQCYRKVMGSRPQA